jgi:hypothetical protein
MKINLWFKVDFCNIYVLFLTNIPTFFLKEVGVHPL